MRTEDIKKLDKAGFRVYRAIDYPRYAILRFEFGEWEVFSYYPNKEKRDEALENLLKDDKKVLD